MDYVDFHYMRTPPQAQLNAEGILVFQWAPRSLTILSECLHVDIPAEVQSTAFPRTVQMETLRKSSRFAMLVLFPQLDATWFPRKKKVDFPRCCEESFPIRAIEKHFSKKGKMEPTRHSFQRINIVSMEKQQKEQLLFARLFFFFLWFDAASFSQGKMAKKQLIFR